VIPDNQAAGFTESLDLPAGLVVDSAVVEVDIDHSWPGDLVLTLVPPVGAAIVLHDRQSGNAPQGLRLVLDAAALPALATLRGRVAQGPWQLRVQDLAALDQGRLLRWALVLAPAAGVVGPTGPQLLEDSAGVVVPDNRSAGISRTLQAAGSARLAQVEVSVDISHPYIGDLRVSLLSPAGTEVLLHAGTGGNTDDIVTRYTPATTPALAQLAGQPLAGNWTLKVADVAADDVGKLNRWGLALHPAA
jgi:subtilisin-like proprotein convertase family protein